MKNYTRIACVLLPLWLGACATSSPPQTVSAPLPAQWLAPLPAQVSLAQHTQKPHQGSLSDLIQ